VQGERAGAAGQRTADGAEQDTAEVQGTVEGQGTSGWVGHGGRGMARCGTDNGHGGARRGRLGIARRTGLFKARRGSSLHFGARHIVRVQLEYGGQRSRARRAGEAGHGWRGRARRAGEAGHG
jgi:hypothetical protein